MSESDSRGEARWKHLRYVAAPVGYPVDHPRAQAWQGFLPHGGTRPSKITIPALTWPLAIGQGRPAGPLCITAHFMVRGPKKRSRALARSSRRQTHASERRRSRGEPQSHRQGQRERSSSSYRAHFALALLTLVRSTQAPSPPLLLRHKSYPVPLHCPQWRFPKLIKLSERRVDYLIQPHLSIPSPLPFHHLITVKQGTLPVCKQPVRLTKSERERERHSERERDTERLRERKREESGVSESVLADRISDLGDRIVEAFACFSCDLCVNRSRIRAVGEKF